MTRPQLYIIAVMALSNKDTMPQSDDSQNHNSEVLAYFVDLSLL